MRLLILLLILSSCNGQNTTPQKTNKKIKQDISMKTFDITFFEENKDNTNEYASQVGDSIFIVMSEWDNEYMVTETNKLSLFQKIKRYYKTGKLKSVSNLFSNFIINYEEYDEEGQLIKTIDYDMPFTYTWENIKEYLRKHKVEDMGKQVIDISRWSDQKGTTWTLEFNGVYNGVKGRYVITLDGKTGEELEVKLFKGKDALGEDATTAIYDTIYKRTN